MSKKPYKILGNRNSPLLMQYGNLDSFRQKIKGTNWSIPTTFISSKKLAGDHCYPIGTRKKMRQLLEKELRANKYTRNFFNEIHRSFKRVIKNIKEFSDKDLKTEPSEVLIRYYNIFYEIFLVTLFPMIVAIYSSDLQDLFQGELLKLLKDKEKDQQNIILLTSMLLTPQVLTFVQQEEQLLLSIQKKYEREHQGKSITKKSFILFCNQPAIQKILQELIVKYGWFHMEYMREPWQQAQYVQHLWQRILDAKIESQDGSSLISPKERLSKIKKKQGVFFKNHPKSRFFKKLVYTLQEFSIILDYSKADLVYGIYLARPLIEEIARRLKINSWVLALNLTPDELRQALQRGELTINNQKNIKKRVQGYALLLRNKKIIIYQGTRAEKLRKQLVEEFSIGGIKEVRGLTAMTGKVRGIVKTVISTKDLAKFEEGDIMVTHDTSTELTSAIRKAAAIVADLGGLISHTAIVAREFNTPCIVQAKIALKVFKDGDFVEVDAEHGKVKRLNNIK